MSRLIGLFIALLLSALPLLADAQDWPDISTPPKSGGGEEDAALVVGIEDYFAVPDVAGARQNARDWYRYFTEGIAIPTERISLLRDNEGTREKILRMARETTARVQPGGTLWFVFIGHGAPGRSGQDGALVGADAQQEADSLYARSVLQNELIDIFAGGQQARTVMLVDACFSGRTSSGAIVKGLQPLIPMNVDISSAPDLVLMSAGTANEFAGPLPGESRPAFSYLMLGAMRGWGDEDGDGRVTASEALNYTRRALASTLRDRSQNPTLAVGDEMTLLSSGLEASPNISEIVSADQPPRPRRVHDGGALHIKMHEDDMRIEVLAADGSRRDCEETPASGECVIDHLPEGRTYLKIEGALSDERALDIRSDQITHVDVDAADNWSGWVALGGAAMMISSVVVLNVFDAGSSATSTDYGIAITTAGLGTATMLIFGIVWLTEWDDVQVKTTGNRAAHSGDIEGAQITWGVAPTSEGINAALVVRW